MRSCLFWGVPMISDIIVLFGCDVSMFFPPSEKKKKRKLMV
jgi:hypothetical protein